MEAVILFLGEEKPFSEYSFLLPFISRERRERIDRTAQNGDRVRSLFAELLIRYEASEQLGADFRSLEIAKGEYGKPYIVGADNGYDFSVSHSAQAVAFAGGLARVGADIELIRRRKKGITERFFAENEVRYIERSTNSDEAFFEIWTKKEAYSKMLGKGLAAGFRSFDVTSGELDCDFYTKTTNGYAFSICSEKKLTMLNCSEMSETEFIEKLSERLDFTLC